MGIGPPLYFDFKTYDFKFLPAKCFKSVHILSFRGGTWYNAYFSVRLRDVSSLVCITNKHLATNAMQDRPKKSPLKNILLFCSYSYIFQFDESKRQKHSPERDTKTLLEISALLKMHKPNVLLTT